MNMLSVKPATGYTVRDPRSGQPLPVEGADVPNTGYWQRRLRDGDVTLITNTSGAKAKAKE